MKYPFAALAFFAISQMLIGQAAPPEEEERSHRLASSHEIEDLAVGLAYSRGNQEKIAAARQRITEIPGWAAWFEDQFRNYAPAARGNIKSKRYQDEFIKESLAATARGRSLTLEREIELRERIRQADSELRGEDYNYAHDRLGRLCFTLSHLKSPEAVRLLGYLLMEEGLSHDGGDYFISSTQQIAAAYISNLAKEQPILGKPPVENGLHEWRRWWQKHYRKFGAPSPTLPGLKPAEDSPPKKNGRQKKGAKNTNSPPAPATEEPPRSKADRPAKNQ